MSQDEPTTETPDDEPFALDARPDLLEACEAFILAAALADTKVWR